jgi:hypothetical protein
MAGSVDFVTVSEILPHKLQANAPTCSGNHH